MRDTPPHIEEKISEMIQLKTPLQRFIMGCSMHETSKQLVIRSILQEHPHISKSDLRVEIFLRFYGNDFADLDREKIIHHLRQQ